LAQGSDSRQRAVFQSLLTGGGASSPSRREASPRCLGAQSCDASGFPESPQAFLIAQQAPRGHAESAGNWRLQGLLRLPASSADWLRSDLGNHVGVCCKSLCSEPTRGSWSLEGPMRCSLPAARESSVLPRMRRRPQQPAMGPLPPGRRQEPEPAGRCPLAWGSATGLLRADAAAAQGATDGTSPRGAAAGQQQMALPSRPVSTPGAAMLLPGSPLWLAADHTIPAAGCGPGGRAAAARLTRLRRCPSVAWTMAPAAVARAATAAMPVAAAVGVPVSRAIAIPVCVAAPVAIAVAGPLAHARAVAAIVPAPGPAPVAASVASAVALSIADAVPIPFAVPFAIPFAVAAAGAGAATLLHG
jgi:hypothetical protein